MGHIVLGANIDCGKPVEFYKAKKKSSNMKSVIADALQETVSKKQAQAFTNVPIDLSYLPHAAGPYHISPNIYDYVMTPVGIVTSGIPNRNMQAFPIDELMRFDPQLGRMVYATFKWKPTHIDHQNKDITQAKGVIIDAMITPVPQYATNKVVILACFDRTKDEWLANAVLSNERPAHSMGSWVENFHCSICDAIWGQCIHSMKIGKGGITYDRKLVYQNCRGSAFFESSNVGDPADVSADSDEIIMLN